MKKMGSFKNNFQSNMLSQEISHFHNRGQAIADKVQTVLNVIRETEEIKHLKNLDSEKVQEIVQEIKERVENGDITGKTGATYISALNQITDYTNHFFDKEIEQIHYSEYFLKSIDYSDKSVSGEVHQSFQSYLQEKYQEIKDEKYQTLQTATELQREFGLRFRESVGLNKETIEKGLESGRLELSRKDWTKNGRERVLEIRTDTQRNILEKAKNIMDKTGKVNLAGGKNWKEYKPLAETRGFADRVRQEFSKTGGNYNFHGERHAWAQSQYSAKWEQKTGVAIQSPIKYYSEQLEAKNWSGEGKFYDAVKEYDIKPFRDYVQEQIQEIENFKEIDQEIRMEISEELGHSRLDITNTYLGHN